MKEGWTYRKFKDVCSSISDGDWIEKKDQSLSGIRLIQTGNIGVGKFIPKNESQKYVSEETFNRLRCTEIFEGDILISRLPNPLGRSCILPKMDKRCITAVDCSILRIKEKLVLPDFFIYYTQSNDYFSKIDAESSGSTRARITRKKLEETLIPVPSLSEQQRIVSRLDAAFSHIDELKVNAEKQLSEARALFQKSLAKAMEPKEGWEEKKLIEITHDNCPISYGIVQQGDHIDGGIPVVRPVDMREKYITRENLKCTTQTISDSYKRTILRGDELLLSVRGTTGIISLATPELKGCNVNRGIVPLYFKDQINKDFLYYEMVSPLLQSVFAEKTTGSTLKQINIKDLRLIKLSLPPLSEQQRIVERLDALSAHVRELEEYQKNIITECDALKQALLRKVFE
jgi:type I restriction enzyme S subunit